MCECHPIPCWSFVDSPCSQCAGECHNDHNHVKQYGSNWTDVTDWKHSQLIMNIIFTCLPLMAIEYSSDERMLNSHYSSVKLRIGSVTIDQNCRCLWQVLSHMPVSEMNVHTRFVTMVQIPSRPRIANTSRLWSVTAYARPSSRPADTVNNLSSRRKDALPWMPTRGAMPRAAWKWLMELHVLIKYKLLLQAMCFTHYNYVKYVRQWKSWKHTWSDVKLKSGPIVSVMIYSIIPYRAST